MTIKRALQILEEERNKWEVETEYHATARMMKVVEVKLPIDVVIIYTSEEFFDNDNPRTSIKVYELEDGIIISVHQNCNRVHWIYEARKHLEWRMWFE